jgi:rhomboid family GlyGly-CTERM serine protease
MSVHTAPSASAATPAHVTACKAVPAKWLVCMAVSALALVATYWPQALELFRLDRSLVFSGQGWRLLSGHLVHLNTPHLMLNLLALFLLTELLWRDLDWRHGNALMLFAALGTSCSLLAWHPELAWYAGLSGMLHGVWAGCALHGLRPAAKSGQAGWPAQYRISIIAIGLLMLKLGAEFYFGPSQRTAQAIGGPVIAVAHAYGAFCGIIYMLAWPAINFLKPAASARFRLK